MGVPALAKLGRAVSLAAIPVSFALPAFADSGAPSDSGAGNALAPRGEPIIGTRALSTPFAYSRSPTGLLYPRAPDYPELMQTSEGSNWWSSAWAEIGYLGSAGTTKTASFREYADWDNGPILNFGFEAENRESAWFLSGIAGSIGRDDQYYELNIGRAGVVNATLFFDTTPHVFSTNAKVLWEGAGTGDLTLRSGLTPGASTLADVNTVLASLNPSEISLTREKAGFSVSYTPFQAWEAFFRLSNEWRDGSRPFGATFGYPFQGGATEILEPIKYRTVDISAGIRFKGETAQANLIYSGSLFRNEIETLIWENPGLTNLAPGAYIPPRGRMPLAPDNDYHTVKSDFAWLIDEVRITGNASFASMRQNDPLIPPTINNGIISGVVAPIDLANWNTLAALSQTSANAAIDIFNAFAQMQWRASPNLNFSVEGRMRDENNETDYLAFNPLTDTYGYIALDGGLAPFIRRLSGIYEPTVAGHRVQIRNIPFATDTWEIVGKAGYRLAARTRLDLNYTHKEISRTAREVSDASDDHFTAQLNSTGHAWGTARFSYEYASVSGDPYVSNPYIPFNSTGLPGYIPRFPAGDTPFTLDELRKFDVADRKQHVLKAQSNFIVAEGTDLQLTGSYRQSDYEAVYGLKDAQTYDLNADLTHQLGLSTTLNVFYSFQFYDRHVSSINPGAASTSGAAGGTTYPLANAWNEEGEDANHVFGASAQHTMGSVTLDVNYTYTQGRSAFAYSYASTGAFFGLTEAQAGNAFPDQDFNHHLLEANVLWRYSESMAVRGYYRLEHEELDDYHYAGLTNVVANNIYLGTVPENYTAHIGGVFFQYRF